MIGCLEPLRRGHGMRCDGFESEKAIGGKPGWLLREAAQSGGESAGGEVDDETKGNLHGDDAVHEAAAGVGIIATLECASGIDTGGAQSRQQAEENRGSG